jgi:hypothetical protein
MDLVLKIRGIYATALTKFFLDRGFYLRVRVRRMVDLPSPDLRMT